MFISRRMKLGGDTTGATPSLNVALVALTLAIVVMILSVVIMNGFRDEITQKLYNLDAHLKVSNGVLGIDDNYATVNGREIYAAIMADSAMSSQVTSMWLTADKPAILKTDSDFKGVELRGVDDGFDWKYLERCLVDGRVPAVGDSAATEVIISQTVARQLQLKTGDKVLSYFIDEKVRVRNLHIVGVYNTDFDTFDKMVVMCNIGLIQQVNGWTADTGNSVCVDLNDLSNIEQKAYQLYSSLAVDTYKRQLNTLKIVSHTRKNNLAFFSWLGMLDMNVIIILTLMFIVSGFTLISALLMIVLERIKMVGLLKALGATNGSIRSIFIYLTAKIIVRAIVLGNIIGIGLALLQKHLHIVRLNPEAYYMPYVPIDINFGHLLMLNVAILVVSYLTLIGPSHIISSIKPTTTMRFE